MLSRIELDLLTPVWPFIGTNLRTLARVALVLMCSTASLYFLSGCARAIDREQPHVEPRRIRIKWAHSSDFIDNQMRKMRDRERTRHA